MGKQLLKSILVGSVLVASSFAGEMPDYIHKIIKDNKKLELKYESINEPNIYSHSCAYMGSAFVSGKNDIKIVTSEFNKLRNGEKIKVLEKVFDKYDDDYVNTIYVRGKKLIEVDLVKDLEKIVKPHGFNSVQYSRNKITHHKEDTIYFNPEVIYSGGVNLMSERDVKNQIRKYVKN